MSVKLFTGDKVVANGDHLMSGFESDKPFIKRGVAYAVTMCEQAGTENSFYIKDEFGDDHFFSYNSAPKFFVWPPQNS